MKMNIRGGFLQIQNKIFEDILFSNFTLREHKVLNIIVRLTIGVNRNRSSHNCKISQSEISKISGIGLPHIKETIQSLAGKGVVVWIQEIKMVKLNINSFEWAMPDKSVARETLLRVLSRNLQSPKKEVISGQLGNFGVPKKVTNQQKSPTESKYSIKDNKNTRIHRGIESIGDVIKRRGP
ncbi:MAG: replication protein [Candidatus Berkelbacteria bacterium]|nr:replication protein [Candidatus Berkelbacteria bacterium]